MGFRSSSQTLHKIYCSIINFINKLEERKGIFEYSNNIWNIESRRMTNILVEDPIRRGLIRMNIANATIDADVYYKLCQVMQLSLLQLQKIISFIFVFIITATKCVHLLFFYQSYCT